MRKNFEDLVKSYIKISEKIIENELGITSVDNELLVYFDKEELHYLLQENNEESVSEQMKFWKAMGFLEVDKKEKRYAKKVKIKNSWVRKFVVNLKPYFTFQEIINNNDEETIFKLYLEHETLVKLFPQKAQEKVIVRGDKLYLDNDYFRGVLSQKEFLSVEEKLRYMKNLGLLETDNDYERFTKTVLVNGKAQKKIMLKNIW
ncbi:hypothetical protein [Clostridium cuniculi]|uniref:TcpK family conjugal transfer DNA-binding protein n=1 Tax=Clostridium cuniculi TaxID=2548455 RepID=UPI001055779D|nr:hypothetical protein [Clostridium cuniculi]